MDFFSFGVSALAGHRGAPVTPNTLRAVEKLIIPMLKVDCEELQGAAALSLYVLVLVKITLCLLLR